MCNIENEHRRGDLVDWSAFGGRPSVDCLKLYGNELMWCNTWSHVQNRRYINDPEGIEYHLAVVLCNYKAKTGLFSTGYGTATSYKWYKVQAV